MTKCSSFYICRIVRPQASTSFMETLPVASAHRLRRAAVLVRYGEGELIHNRGDDKPGLSIVHRGHVRVGIYGYAGTFILSALLGPGQTFGEFTLLAGLPRTHDAVAASSDTEVHHLSEEPPPLPRRPRRGPGASKHHPRPHASAARERRQVSPAPPGCARREHARRSHRNAG